MPTSYAPFPWGTSTAADLSAWLVEWNERTEPGEDGRTAETCRQEARRLGQVADAYAHGWIAGRSGTLAPGEYDALLSAAYRFGHEYERAAWLYATGQRGSRDGYGRAWEHVLQVHGH